MNKETATILIGYALVYAYLFFHVFVHELGHYLAAKAFNFKINKLRIGMGPTLVKWGAVSVNIIPLSGGADIEETPDKYPKQYIVIAASGVALNVSVALVLNWMWWRSPPENMFLCYASLIVFSLLYSDITNFLPLRDRQGNMSDGGVILACLQDLRKTPILMGDK